MKSPRAIPEGLRGATGSLNGAAGYLDGCLVSALAVLGVQAIGLILDVRGNLVELVGVCAGVVGAKQQLSYGHEHTHVSLRSAPVAPVGCGQWGGGGG